MVRRAALALAWLICAAPGAAEEAPEDLPEGQGREETFYACTPCHSTAIVRSQGLSRENWQAALEWMTERHGLPRFEAAERDLILDYLAHAFPPRQRRGFTSPFEPTR
jgi:hypothetical protein